MAMIAITTKSSISVKHLVVFGIDITLALFDIFLPPFIVLAIFDRPICFFSSSACVCPLASLFHFFSHGYIISVNTSARNSCRLTYSNIILTNSVISADEGYITTCEYRKISAGHRTIHCHQPCPAIIFPCSRGACAFLLVGYIILMNILECNSDKLTYGVIILTNRQIHPDHN
jgi:hypothetical protein